MATEQHSPLHEVHVALGAKLADFGGWLMPIEYPSSGVLKEHAAVRDEVGIFDVSHLGKVSVTGVAAANFVNGVLTNDMSRLSPGQAQYTMLCNNEGGVVDDLIAYLIDDEHVFLIPNAANTSAVVTALREAAPPDLAVVNEHHDYAVLAVQGPLSADVLRELNLPSDLLYMNFVDATWQDVPVRVCRTGYTGEHGYELVCRASDAKKLWSAALAVPQAVSPCGLGARDTLRTEMGYPLHGHELSPSITPVQARLSWSIGWDKPRFVGRSALVDERAAGPARQLWGLLSNDRAIPRPAMKVSDAATGKPCGEVTSGTFSPTLRKGLALALLDARDESHWAVGDEVSVDVRGRASVMTVVRPPFVRDRARS